MVNMTLKNVEKVGGLTVVQILEVGNGLDC